MEKKVNRKTRATSSPLDKIANTEAVYQKRLLELDAGSSEAEAVRTVLKLLRTRRQLIETQHAPRKSDCEPSPANAAGARDREPAVDPGE